MKQSIEFVSLILSLGLHSILFSFYCPALAAAKCEAIKQYASVFAHDGFSIQHTL